MLALNRRADKRIRFDDTINCRKGPLARKGRIETCSKGVARSYRCATFTVTVVAVLLVIASTDVRTVSAQNQPAVAGTNILVRGGQGGYGGGGFFPYDGNGGWGMPGTAQSAAEYGMASMIAASGYANLQNSIALKNIEAARGQDINNRVQWTNAYYQMRQAHRAYVADHSRLSMQEITKIANDAAPKRLDATQLDLTTGKILWPIIMQDPRYTTLTYELENLYSQRATASGSVGAEIYRNIQNACDELLNLLKGNINEYRPDDFIQARRLVRSLRYEARFPVSNRVDAQSVAKL